MHDMCIHMYMYGHLISCQWCLRTTSTDAQLQSQLDVGPYFEADSLSQHSTQYTVHPYAVYYTYDISLFLTIH